MARPNVLLFITDQQRHDALGYTGRTPCRTPNLDRLAGEGVAFDRCLTPDPICSPARAALFTGRYPHATGVRHNNRLLPLERPALPEVVPRRRLRRRLRRQVAPRAAAGRGGDHPLGRRAGARVPRVARPAQRRGHLSLRPARVSLRPPRRPTRRGQGPGQGGHLQPPHRRPTRPLRAHLRRLGREPGPRAPRDPSAPASPSSTSARSTARTPSSSSPSRTTRSTTPRTPPSRPTFADPMDSKPAFQRRSIWHQAARAHGTEWEPWQKSHGRLLGLRHLARRADRARPRPARTRSGSRTTPSWLFTTDHGEMMGSHGLFQKSCMYEESLRVPFIVRAAPAHPPPAGASTLPVSHVDLAPTLLSLSGLATEGQSVLEPQGRDLSAWLTGASPVPPASRGASDDPAAGAVFCQYTPHGADRAHDRHPLHRRSALQVRLEPRRHKRALRHLERPRRAAQPRPSQHARGHPGPPPGRLARLDAGHRRSPPRHAHPGARRPAGRGEVAREG